MTTKMTDYLGPLASAITNMFNLFCCHIGLGAKAGSVLALAPWLYRTVII